MLVKYVLRTVIVSIILSCFIYSGTVWSLSAKQRAQIYADSSESTHPPRNIGTVKSTEWLHSQIYIAELMYRDDIVEAALDRLLAIDSKDVIGLAAQARLDVQRNNITNGKQVLIDLLKLYPKKRSVLLLQTYLSAHTDNSAEYRQIKLLTKLGRTQDAIEKYEAIFPYGMPTNLIKLDYLSLLGEKDANWTRVKNELEQMNYQFPGVPILQLHLATHLRKREPANTWVLSTLQRLSVDPKLGRQAADAWLRSLSDMPVTASWAKYHALLASYFPDDLEIQQANISAQSRWRQEQEWLKDPTYIAKLRGIALMKSDDPKKLPSAYKQLSYALTTRPKDSELLEAMGKYYLRKGKSEKALSYFKRAKRYDDDPDNLSKYNSLIHTSQYWTYLERGDLQVEKGNFTEAKKNYLKALGLSPNIVYGYNRLASLALLGLNYTSAVSRYKQAIKKVPLNKTALRGILRTYSKQGQYKTALQQAEAFSIAQRKVVRDDISALRVKILAQKLQGYSVDDDKLKIAKVIDELIKVSPKDPWIRADIADYLFDKGLITLANNLMEDWSKSSRDPEMAFAYGEFLSKQARLEEAIAVMDAVPKAQRSVEMDETLKRFTFQFKVNSAVALYEQEPDKAVELLQSYTRPDEIEGHLELASAWIFFGDQEKARAVIGSPDLSEMSTELLLRYGKILVDIEDEESFQQWRLVVREQHPLFTYAHQVKWATVLYDANEGQEATQLLAQLTDRKDGSVVDKWKSLTVAMENQQWETAETLAYQTLLADRQEKQPLPEGEGEGEGEGEKTLSLETMYIEADDYWLTRNVKSDIDTLRAREDGHIKMGFDFGFQDGENQELQVPFEARVPFSEYDGHLVVKVDYVQLSSGKQTFYDSDVSFDHDDSGTAVGLGWEANDWRADIGTTPMGFLNTELVGGIEKNYDLDSYSLRAVLSRRPETSTTVSYAGMVVEDSQSSQEWGGVLSTGVNIGVSWDEGGPYGGWSSIQYHSLSGENVADNTRFALLGGGYWKLINDDDERLSIGASAFYMSYDKNLGEYALGHGPYYSPQSYFSLSLPISYYGRYQNIWAYSAYASVSNSWSELDAPYKLNGSKDTGGGFGYTLRLAVEKRIAPKWFLGAMLDAERSDSYDPNHFQLYAKYTFSNRWQPIQSPPEPITLYAGYY